MCLSEVLEEKIEFPYNRWERVYTSIRSVVYDWKDSLETSALVGSASPQSHELYKIGSDLDLIVLWKNSPPDPVDEFLQHLLHEIRKFDHHWTIIEGWGVVSPWVVNSPVIHLHSAPLKAYLSRSMLYRRSLAKYDCIIGTPISHYSPSTPMSLKEFMEDSLGPKALLNLLDQEVFKDTIWRWVNQEWKPYKKDSQAAEPIDYALYSVLHSVRNTLRLLGQYEEFSPLMTLSKQWIAVGGPEENILEQLIELKTRRRKMETIEIIHLKQSYEDAILFLKSLLNWLD